MAPASLCGLPEKSTFAKTYQLLKTKLEAANSIHICDYRDCRREWAEILESVLASLSDAQFEVFVKILASSPRARHRRYLSICALRPGELEWMQNFYAQHSWNLSVPSPFAFAPIFQGICVGEPEPQPDGMVVHQPSGRHRLYISFSIDDVDGAFDLLVKTAHKTSHLGLDPNVSNILLLQQFASLCQTVSEQLLRKWESKYKSRESWKGIDEVTLDLRRAYAPDGVYLPTGEWLQELKESRDAKPTVYSIRGPTRRLTRDTFCFKT